ncbi:hypothetical protein [Acinetobacter modestus]|uniref:hypothetical protein n=1 Tax=Acinetobacter modestus TaxID=1776740 RepID=UPI00301A44F0
MSKKITDRVKFCLNRHNDANSAKLELQQWTDERRNFFLSKMDWIEKSLDQGNHEAYRIAFNQLKLAINQQKETLDKVHDIILFEDN